MKSVLNGYLISNKDRLNLKNISSLSLSNFGNTELVVTCNNVSETIARFDTANNSAPNWSIDGDGTYCDIEIHIDFLPEFNGTNKAILRYRQVLTT